MPPDQFVQEGAPLRIRRILTDLAENSSANITDGKEKNALSICYFLIE